MLKAAQALGAAEILITDLEQQRLHLSKELGATHTLLLDREQSAEQLAKRVRSTMGQSPEQAVLDFARSNYIAKLISWGFVCFGGHILSVLLGLTRNVKRKYMAFATATPIRPLWLWWHRAK
ncbi:uncharacterized protein LOC117586211 [Drosophila guanche]|uniref:uncharacterized protein LOC117586211 n=1 Tax=Drosophila guanche TaxID=7266 RepID=UPI001471CF25|nr:uncharacterized protein LOC117586211 [Drosophila guanche]